MSNKNEGKSQAEIYREERKARLEKAAKKNAKKTPEMIQQSKKASKVVLACFASVLAVLLLALIVKSTGLIEKHTTALVVDGTKVSTAEYQYYYSNTYYNLLNYSAYYDAMYSQYMEGYGATMTGLDSTKLPSKQPYEGDEIPESEGIKEPTMQDYLNYQTKLSIQSIIMLCNEATDNGITLDETDLKEITTQIDDLKKTAQENNFTVNAYLKTQYKVKGLNEKLYTEILKREALATKYSELKQKDFETEIEKDNLVQKTYEANKDDYDLVDIAVYSVKGTAEGITDKSTDEQKKAANTAANEKAKTDANSFLANVTDANSFNTLAEQDTHSGTASITTKDKSTITSTYSEEVANWVYDDARKVGDKTLIEKKATTTDENGNTVETGEPSTFYVVCMKTLPYLSTSADVRHILIAFETKESTTETTEVSAEAKAAALKKAEDVLAEWKSGEATEKSFTELAKKYSGDVDEEGNLNNDGLYADVTPTSNYVENFLGWIFDSKHNVGDTGIVETEYGYHIMYFSADNGASWTNTIKENLVNEKLEKFSDELSTSDTYKINANNFFTKYAIYLSKGFIKYFIANPIDYSSQMYQQ